MSIGKVGKGDGGVINKKHMIKLRKDSCGAQANSTKFRKRVLRRFLFLFLFWGGVKCSCVPI